ncbi:putative fatty-acid-CoA ligase FadD [Streptomyces albospinus]|uniref:Fatty-acid-CoA ligase FadD n=1 Tax=Streptomyces albospinus TaxID=285515 RepID=A0ABQ2VLV0_9ACTN|nr:AMP-binding protein [Streptomyces albospinus]GGU95624.1 putative fatty-acid-CoA ligase FadD [Streptomyces albospinus]
MAAHSSRTSPIPHTPTPDPAPRTIAELVRAQWGDHRIGLKHGESAVTHHQLAAGAAARAALLGELLPRDAEPHIGVLLDNVPEYPLWIGAAALAGAAVAGINPTRRGPELARDIAHTDCALLITERAHLPLLAGLDLPLPPERVLIVDDPAYQELLAPYGGARPDAIAAVPGGGGARTPGPATRLLLCFTSGSTGAPKAAICTQGRLAAAGHSLVRYFAVCPEDVHYLCMPMFHGNAVIAGWAPALAGGAAVALRRRFSASAFLPDVRRYGATYFTYVGRAVQYLLATPPAPDDRDNPLRTGFGTEAGAVDAARFADRFGVRLVEGYGSSEGGAALQRTEDTPPGAIGRPAPGDDLAVVDPATGAELPRARLDAAGRLLNGDRAIGELVNRGRSSFEGYWRNPEATAARTRGRAEGEAGAGWYWTGDLFFRDENGFFHFAGRADDRLRVDSENLAAAMIEDILARYAPAAGVAVYAVPDPVAGDQVMAALALRDGAAFDPDGFAAFLAAQPDLGTKMAPRFVRIVAALPVTATNKVHRVALRWAGFRCPEPVWWSPQNAPGTRATPAGSGHRPLYRPFTDEDRAALMAQYRDHDRGRLLDR